MGIVKDFLNSNIPSLTKVDDKQNVGIGGFTAFVATSRVKNLTSTSPNVTLEDGSTISDTIFLNPIEFSIEGEVADVNLKTPTDDVFRSARQAIGVITPYLPERSATQINKINNIITDATTVIDQADDLIQRGSQLYDLFGDKTDSKPLQEQFLDYLEKIWKSKSLITIEFPYRTYENVRIEDFQSTETNADRRILFSITCKQIRLAELAFAQVQQIAPNPVDAVKGQVSDVVDKGVTQGEPVNGSLLSRIVGSL